jgi:predicted secreted hydrolase
LLLKSRKPPAIHGSGGVTRKGACRSCASHYYSLTRLVGGGTLALDGRPINVKGQAWMDHEYASSQLLPTQAGWDWFSFQFSDGRELMYYRMRTRDGGESPESSGSLIDRDGRVSVLRRRDLDCRVLAHWTSQESHGIYPSAWDCAIPKAHLEFQVIPRLENQELSGSNPVMPTYWEGDVALRRDSREIGTGYVELTGYVTPLHL